MKINIYHTKICALLFFLAIAFASCSKKKDTLTKENVQLKSVDFKNAGIQHNERLNNIFNKLKLSMNKASSSSKASTMTDSYRDNILEMVEGACIQDINNDPYPNTQLRDEMVQFTSQIFNQIPIVENNNIYNSTTASNLTQSQINVLDQLNVVLTDDDESITSLQNRITLIEEQIPSLNLNEQDQTELYITTNTARYSLAYWNENYYEWAQLINSANQVNSKKSVPKTLAFSWKRVGKGDVAGAAAGALAFGGAAIFGGPVSWSAFGASVGGWAAGCSAYEAIMQLW